MKVTGSLLLGEKAIEDLYLKMYSCARDISTTAPNNSPKNVYGKPTKLTKKIYGEVAVATDRVLKQPLEG
jgi:hypothetical protein